MYFLRATCCTVKQDVITDSTSHNCLPQFLSMTVRDLSLLSWSPLVLSPLTRVRRDKAMAISPSALWIPFSSVFEYPPLFCSMKYTDQSANRTLTAITDFSLLIHQAWLEQNLPSLSTAIRREGEQQKQGKGMISVTPLMGFTYLWIFLCMPVDTANLCFCL